MTPRELFIHQVNDEYKRTLNAINSLPDNLDRLDYKPHPKARSARQLVEHLLPHIASMATAVKSKVIQESPVSFASKAEMAAYLKKHTDDLTSNLSAIDDNTFENANVDFIINPVTKYTMPMVHMFYMFLFDVIHHRGQLSTHYRAMEARNPNIYGPSAEDIEEMMAAAAASN